MSYPLSIATPVQGWGNSNVAPSQVVEDYFRSFKSLSKSEKWQEIMSLGQVALEAANSTDRVDHQAKICAQLTSTAFYLGNYITAQEYVERCYQLSKDLPSPNLLIRALYLRSGVHRALAAKANDVQTQRELYQSALSSAEEAIVIYEKRAVDDELLKGKLYFNLGAAHADDNPFGNLEEAARCYEISRECYIRADSTDDVVRTDIRLGKLHLLRKEYRLCQGVIDTLRARLLSMRCIMHTDYLEAQLKYALCDFPGALKIAAHGVELATDLEAKEDLRRLVSLLKNIRGVAKAERCAAQKLKSHL